MTPFNVYAALEQPGAKLVNDRRRGAHRYFIQDASGNRKVCDKDIGDRLVYGHEVECTGRTCREIFFFELAQ